METLLCMHLSYNRQVYSDGHLRQEVEDLDQLRVLGSHAL